MELNYSSAGSGKTFELAKQYIQKVIDGENVNNIYCLTFTKKATNEIKQRVMKFAKGLLDLDFFYLEIFNIKKIDKKIKENLENVVEYNLQIHTIDSFLFKILKFLSLDSYRLIQEEELFRMVEKVKEKFVFKLDKLKKDDIFELIEILKNIYISKRSAVNKMLKESNKDNLFNLFKYKSLDKNKLNERILANLEKYGFSNKDTIIEDFLNSNFINKKFMSLDFKETKQLKYEEKELFKTILLYIKAYLFMEKSNLKLKDLFNFFTDFENDIELLKNKQKGIDYNDILIKLDLLLENEDNKENFNYFIFNNIGHILIDEYQDTSSYQDKILSIIFKILSEGENNVSKKPSIYLVGDVKQSIYEWRDADSNIFLNKEKEILKGSYRILDGNDKIIEEKINKIDEVTNLEYIPTIKKNNITRRLHPNLVKKLNEVFSLLDLKDFSPHEAIREDKGNSNFEEIEITKDTLVEETVKKVEELLVDKEYKDICILARNNETLNILEQKFNELKIPTKKDTGGMGESYEVEVTNIVFLSVLLIKNDFYFQKLCELLIESKEDVYDYFINKKPNKEISKIKEKILEIKNLNISIEDKIFKIIDTFCLYSLMFQIRERNSINVFNRYIEYLFEQLKYIKNENEFVDRLINIKRNKSLTLDLTEEINAVSLLTIHKSKGLEFDTVLLIEKDIFNLLNTGIKVLPSGKVVDLGKNKLDKPFGYEEYESKVKIFEEEEKQSQLRLYYVGMTRAKNNLYILKGE